MLNLSGLVMIQIKFSYRKFYFIMKMLIFAFLLMAKKVKQHIGVKLKRIRGY